MQNNQIAQIWAVTHSYKWSDLRMKFYQCYKVNADASADSITRDIDYSSQFGNFIIYHSYH